MIIVAADRLRKVVALRKESVDRNSLKSNQTGIGFCRSP